MLAHAVWRSVALILLGIFLRSLERPQTYWTFEDTLTQIGLGYTVLFLLRSPRSACRSRRSSRSWSAFWAAFAALSAARPDFDYAQVGVPADWPHLYSGFLAHFNKNSNLVVGVRRVVPQPVPARGAVPLQRRRLVHPELHSDAGDDAARAVGGAMAADAARRDGEAEGARRRAASCSTLAGLVAAVAAHLPDRQAHLDLVVHALQRRAGAPDAGRLLRRRSSGAAGGAGRSRSS